jgi:NAD(P)-dependent dehydrogenase (short-subunit alcohol dehydrogenase family)
MSMGVLERFRLDGKTAIVTGASSGLGVAFAVALAEAGADVALGARRIERLEDTAKLVTDLGQRAVVVPTDITKPEECQRLTDEAMASFGRVDILINNAGTVRTVPAIRENPDEFRAVVDVNLMGTYWMSQACARIMNRGSSIINIGSVLGLSTAGLPQAAYSASKAGILGLTRDLAQQWSGRRGIRVNAIAPGWFATEINADAPRSFLDEVIDYRVLVGRMGELDECASAVVFLASPAAAYITGVVLPVDGGFLTT